MNCLVLKAAGTIASACAVLMLVSVQGRTQSEESQCLSLSEVQGGYPRYHIVNGRHCWYASTRGPQRAPAEAKEARPTETNVNPYDDPIWQEPDAGNVQPIAVRARNCEEQALKLDVKEKRAFMKQCMSN